MTKLNKSIRSQAIMLFFTYKGEEEILTVSKNGDISLTLRSLYESDLKHNGYKIEKSITNKDVYISA